MTNEEFTGAVMGAYNHQAIHRKDRVTAIPEEYQQDVRKAFLQRDEKAMQDVITHMGADAFPPFQDGWNWWTLAPMECLGFYDWYMNNFPKSEKPEEDRYTDEEQVKYSQVEQDEVYEDVYPFVFVVADGEFLFEDDCEYLGFDTSLCMEV